MGRDIMSIVLDTCALIWWTLDQDKLNSTTNSLLSEQDENLILVSSISIWEIGIKIKNKKLDIGISIQEYTRKLNLMNTFEFIPIDNNLWIKSLELDWQHKDPADRLIVATAKHHDAELVTNDLAINSFYKKCIF
jgi:PIN domain nuclease of toxin-antitoxin system